MECAGKPAKWGAVDRTSTNRHLGANGATMSDVKQCLFCAELNGGQQLLLVVMEDDRLALLRDGVVDRIWDSDELGANGAVTAFLNTCQRTGTIPAAARVN